MKRKENKKPVLLKEIPLLPTNWTLDVVICSSNKTLKKFCIKRYGIERDSDSPLKESKGLSCVMATSKNSDLKGEHRMAVFLKEKDLGLVAHELIHTLWQMKRWAKLEVKEDSEEWQAIMYEYMIKHAMDDEGYEQLKF